MLAPDGGPRRPRTARRLTPPPTRSRSASSRTRARARPALAALLASGEAKRSHGALALTHADGRRCCWPASGARSDFDAERARGAPPVAAHARGELGARHLCWELPRPPAPTSRRRLSRARCSRGLPLRPLPRAADGARRSGSLGALTSPPRRRRRACRARHRRRGQNRRARAQDTPANDMTPGDLADDAQQLATAPSRPTVSSERRDRRRGMGAFAAVAQGIDGGPGADHARYEGPDASGPLLG